MNIIKFVCTQRLLSLLAVGTAIGIAAPAQAQWVTLANSGTPLLSTINPKTAVSSPGNCTNTSLPPVGDQIPVNTQSPTLATGRFSGLPGSAAMPGYTLVRTATPSPINVGSPTVTVGNVYERVYCTGTASGCDGTNTYVFATRAIVNTNVWTAAGTSFEINDYFRVVPTTATVQVGYYMGVSNGAVPDDSQAFKYLEYSGRTNNGLIQAANVYNLGYVNFRVDTNANDPDRCEPYSYSSSNSPWLYAKLSCPNGVSTGQNAFKIRLRQGSEEGQGVYSVSLPGFVCN